MTIKTTPASFVLALALPPAAVADASHNAQSSPLKTYRRDAIRWCAPIRRR